VIFTKTMFSGKIRQRYRPPHERESMSRGGAPLPSPSSRGSPPRFLGGCEGADIECSMDSWVQWRGRKHFFRVVGGIKIITPAPLFPRRKEGETWRGTHLKIAEPKMQSGAVLGRERHHRQSRLDFFERLAGNTFFTARWDMARVGASY